ncbi:hypothetical protein BGX28_008245 [Mortierella sp. GBA30]|nr:hypothetical protein BGX28_008245 [Mortierella sp. GBA30]
MAALSTALPIVSSLVTTITSSVSRVKFNKRICERLARKCQWLEELLNNGDLGAPSDPALKQLIGLLTVCDKDLKKFASFGFLMRIIRSGGIPEICEEHMTELDDWKSRIRDRSATKVKQDAAEPAEDEDEFDQEDAMRYEIKVSRNQEDARNALLSQPAPPRLIERAIVNPDYLSTEREQVGTFPFGTIYRGTYSGEAVYIRELRSDIPDAAIANIRAGILLAQCLSDCGNIVSIYGFCGNRTIVTGMPANGPLSEYKSELTTVQRVTIARKVADALVFMFDITAEAGRKRVVHRDIRAANVLLSDTLEPMLTGFEMCKGDGDLTGFRPDVEDSLKRWWPRERLSDCGTFPESDVYSFGVLMYEISTGREPEEGADLVALEGSRICAEYTALMAKCLQHHGNARPKIDRVMEELLTIETNLEPDRARLQHNVHEE